MKGENKVRWLKVMLSEKKHRKRLILDGKSLSKSEWARIAKTEFTNPQFQEFFKEMINEGIFIEIDKKYLIEPERAYQKIMEFDSEKKFESVVIERWKWGLK